MNTSSPTRSRLTHEYLVTGAPTWLDAVLITVHIPALMFIVIPQHHNHFLMFIIFLAAFAVQWWWTVKRGQTKLFGYSRLKDRRNDPKRYILSSAINILTVIPVLALIWQQQPVNTWTAVALAVTIYAVLILNAKFNTPWIMHEDATPETVNSPTETNE